MTTKTFDSTVSQLLQDDSSAEYVAPEKNPLTTIQNSDLIFGQKHNDIDCALCPTAKRACDRAWVTAKQVENWSKMSKTTLWRWLERLEKARRISTVSDLKQWSIPHAQGGSTPTTFYNLNVLNQLAMACIDNIDSLLEDEEIAYCDISQYAIPGGNNRTYETTLYNLNVFA